MRNAIILVALLLLTASGFAEDTSTGKEPPKQPEAAEVKKSPGQELRKDKPSLQWPRPYKPTEEISADSMVPFPTDI